MGRNLLGNQLKKHTSIIDRPRPARTIVLGRVVMTIRGNWDSLLGVDPPGQVDCII